MTTLMDRRIFLTTDDVLSGYDVVKQLYPFIPPMTIWRSWEYAAYRKFELPEPVLDVGCGDGKYFRLVWPNVHDVVGVDIEQGVVNAALQSGVYKKVIVTPADTLPFGDSFFSSAFANCSLEHMDNLRGVLQSINRVLRPGATFLLSIVTDKFVRWTSLPLLVQSVGEPERARRLKNDYLSYHHLVNPLTPEEWLARLETAGFELLSYIPIIPELLGRLFLFIDNLWHVRSGEVEVGQFLEQYFTALPGFPSAVGGIIESCLRAEADRESCCGAVFSVRKERTSL